MNAELQRKSCQEHSLALFWDGKLVIGRTKLYGGDIDKIRLSEKSSCIEG